jgi:hypothetical protein
MSIGYYATAEVDLADVDAFLTKARAPATAPFVAFGQVGAGIASWWICYQLITDTLALFMRLPFGGIDSSDEEAARIVNGCLLRAEELVVAADAAAARTGRCIVIVDALEDGFVEISGDRRDSEDPIGDALAALTHA